MAANLTPAFVALHGNRLEALSREVFAWIGANPLGPLEEEVFLVQSNGVADWLKVALAEEIGICAATRVMLPARFLWQSYRNVLGTDSIAPTSPFDRKPLTWRLMGLLPTLIDQPGFAPLRHFLAGDDPERRLQLAQRVGELMDQYQVYRADWLAHWARGDNGVLPAAGPAVPLAADQCWQPQLWRAILDSVGAGQGVGRGGVHADFIAALAAGKPPAPRLPRRVILLGISALPRQTLEALAALSKRMQVIVAVPNPCQYYWADAISGAALLHATRKRQPYRNGIDVSSEPAETLHAQCHPLLAGWGRLGRDFVRMLDEFDDAGVAAAFQGVRLELFGNDAGSNMLTHLQADIRDMAPSPAPEARRIRDPGDHSVQFHIAHSIQREVEILHDRLLDALGETPAVVVGGEATAPLCPRDIIVMVPDIEAFTPAIRAVFGQHHGRDPRQIPFAIVDLSQRRRDPIVVALDWLLRLPQQRCLQTEVRDLLDVPSVARRFGIAADDLPRLAQWIEESAIRWGLDHPHRDSLGMGPMGDQNAWLFGVRRMLMGYACGAGAGFAGIAPYAEVGGLDAGLAGALSRFVETLIAWRNKLCVSTAPRGWAVQARALLDAFFKPVDDEEKAALSQLYIALGKWQEDCRLADFAQSVPLAVMREAWLEALDEPGLDRRFVSGGVTFCTMMPMRAVPFRMVCLLGMNDGDFPRRTQRADFDLLAMPGMQRPGDRSRRDDDRYLMLEAVLSARDTLYVSWVGRNVRDNTVEPPSVLVAQLRDCLVAGWQIDADELLTSYPLQPFSRRYFEAPAPAAASAVASRAPLRTHAHEWRAAHAAAKPSAAGDGAALPPWTPDPGSPLSLHALTSFLTQPVDYFYRQRLQVYFGRPQEAVGNDEVFALDGLQNYGVAERLLADDGTHEADSEVEALLQARAARLGREGVLPVGFVGALTQETLVRELVPARRAWLALHRENPCPREPLPVAVKVDGDMRLVDWLDALHAPQADAGPVVWFSLRASKFIDKKFTQKRIAARNALRVALRAGLAPLTPIEFMPRVPKLVGAWLRQLAAAAQGHVITGKIVAGDAVITLYPVPQERARAMLDEVVACWKAGHAAVLPVACETALALVQQGKPETTYEGSAGSYAGANISECDKHPALARHWPDFAALETEPDWPTWAERLYQPLDHWAAAYVDVVPHDPAAFDVEEEST